MGSCFLDRGRWVIKYRDASGRTVRDRTHARTRDEAEMLLHQCELDSDWIRLLNRPRPRRETIAELWAWWSEHYLTDDMSEAKASKQVARDYILPQFGELLPAQLVPARIVTAWRELAKLHPRTHNRARGVLKRLVRDAIANGRWPVGDPMPAVPCAKIPKKARRTLTPMEGHALLTTAVEPWRTMFAVMIYTAMRPGEVYALRRCDVDLVAGVIHVRHSHERLTPKNGNPRDLPIVPELVPYLTERCRRPIPSGALLFPNPINGQRFRRDFELSDVFREQLVRAGVVAGWSVGCPLCGGRVEYLEQPSPSACESCGRDLETTAVSLEIRAYDLRHTWTTLAVEAGVDREVRVIVLDHHPQDAQQIYEHWTMRRLGEEMRKVSLYPSPAGQPAVNPQNATAPEVATSEAGSTSPQPPTTGEEAMSAEGIEPSTYGLRAQPTKEAPASIGQLDLFGTNRNGDDK